MKKWGCPDIVRFELRVSRHTVACLYKYMPTSVTWIVRRRYVQEQIEPHFSIALDEAATDSLVDMDRILDFDYELEQSPRKDFVKEFHYLTRQFISGLYIDSAF